MKAATKSLASVAAAPDMIRCLGANAELEVPDQVRDCERNPSPLGGAA